MAEQMMTQCLLQRDNAFQTAWIEQRGAIEGAEVELKTENGEFWRVARVYDTVPASVVYEVQKWSIPLTHVRTQDYRPHNAQLGVEPSPPARGEGDVGVSVGSVRLTGYRGFREFEMKSLGRVNLIVGKNNTGKSSLLEALYMLASGNAPVALLNVLARRGEQIVPEPSPGQIQIGQADVSHLFYGHAINEGCTFSIATTNGAKRSVEFRIGMADREANIPAFNLFPDEGVVPQRLALWITGEPDSGIPPLPLSRTGALRTEVVQPYANTRAAAVETGSVQFIAPESMSVQQLTQSWQSIVLTPAEDRATKALQILEPAVDRIAQVNLVPVQVPNGGFAIPTRGGFFVKLKDVETRVGIGSFGDGMWRLLSLSVALARAKDSVLMVDEIDTGLHYTVMAAMWKMIYEGAKEFKVQVFATTHSQDCVNALASVCRDSETLTDNQITLQRIEAGKKESVLFDEPEIIAAARRHVEIR